MGASPSVSTELLCNNNHNLEFSTVRSEANKFASFFKCNNCKKYGFLCSAGRFACLQCGFNLCWKCKKPEKFYLAQMCLKNHPLIYTLETGLKYVNGKYDCDICKTANLNCKDGRYACLKCVYDVCHKCRPPQNSLPDNLCPNNHSLKFTSAKGNGASNASSSYTCSLCQKKALLYKSGRFACLECNYDVCQSCKVPDQDLIRKKCPKNHYLCYTTEVGKLYEDHQFFCDICKSSLPCNEGRYSCLPCTYDICNRCRQGDSAAHTIICPSNHILVFSSEKRNDINSAVYSCNLCKKTDLSIGAMRYACIQCSYNLCWQCRNPEPHLLKCLSTCSKMHKLLFQNNVLGESKNSLVCSICKKVDIPPHGFWKCDICQFNLCNSCKAPDIVDYSISSIPISNPASTENEMDTCKICFSAKINSVLIPCGHIALCFNCASTLAKKLCPICNSNIKSIVKTYHA